MSIKHHNYSLTLEFDKNYNDDKQYAVNAIRLISETRYESDLLKLQQQGLVPFGYVYRCIQSDNRVYIGKRIIQAHKQWGYYLGSSKYLDYDRIIRKELIAFAYDHESLAELEIKHIQNAINNANSRHDVINKRVKVHDSWSDKQCKHDNALIENIGIGLLSDLYFGLGSINKIHEYLNHSSRKHDISLDESAKTNSISKRTISNALSDNGIMKMQTIMRTYNNTVIYDSKISEFHNVCMKCQYEFKTDDDGRMFCSNTCACDYYVNDSMNDAYMREYILLEYDITELGYSNNIMRTICKHYLIDKKKKQNNNHKQTDAVISICYSCVASFSSDYGSNHKYCSVKCRNIGNSIIKDSDITSITEMLNNNKNLSYIADKYNVTIPTVSEFIKKHNIKIPECDDNNNSILTHQRAGAYNAHMRWHEHENIIKNDCIYCMNDNESLKPLKYQPRACLNPLCSHIITTSSKKHTCSQKCGFIYGRIMHYYNNHKKKHMNTNNSNVHSDVIKYCWFCNHNEFNDDCITIKDMIESAYHGLIHMHALLCEHVRELHDNGMSRNRIALDYGISRSMTTDLLNGRKLF